MYGQIDLAVEQGALQLFSENALTAKLAQRPGGDIALGLDDLDVHFEIGVLVLE